MFDFLKDVKLDGAVTDEILLVAYDYNSQQPRFFSKFFESEDGNIYNNEIWEATGASSAAPTYFDPKNYTNGYGE